MKKIFTMLAVVLAVVSCQREINGLPVDSNGEAAVSLNVGLPEGATRAAGSDSALGAIDNGMDMNLYDIRFILEVYDDKGELAKDRMVNSGDSTSTTFNFRIVPGRDYKFVVWADFVLDGSQADLHYETTNGLRLVAIKDWTAIDESRDAYTEAVDVENYSSITQIPTIVLTRPFAKLRVVTNDIKEMISVRPATVKVNYFDTKFYTAFDAFKEEPIDNTYDGHELVVDLNEDKYTNEDPDTTGVMTLFADYMFAKEGDRVKFTMDVVDNGGIAIPQVIFSTDIPINRNYLTTVYGPILTDANNVTVTIDANFAAETIYLEGDVTLTEDMEINRPIVVREGVSAVLNLNGHNITVNHNSGVTAESEGIIVYGDLTIEGEGTIEASSRAIWARGNTGANVTINGGNFIGAKSDTEVIYASGNGKIEINGGKFEAKTMSTGFTPDQYAVLNLHNNGKDGCDIVVKGGSFKNFNPADNVSENPKKNFCAEGYLSVANGEWFDVVKGAIVGTVEDLKAALENPEYTYIAFSNDINFDSVALKVRHDMTIDMANYKFTSGVNQKLYAVNVGNCEVVLENANINGGGINAWNGGKVTFNSGKLYNNNTNTSRYSIWAYGEGSVVTIKNGDFTWSKVNNRLAWVADGAVLKIEGGNFAVTGYIPSTPFANVGYQTNEGGQIIITGGTFGFDPSQWVADGYTATKNGNIWTVSKN